MRVEEIVVCVDVDIPSWHGQLIEILLEGLDHLRVLKFGMVPFDFLSGRVAWEGHIEVTHCGQMVLVLESKVKILQHTCTLHGGHLCLGDQDVVTS